MSKYTFFNRIINDTTLVETMAKTIHSQLLVLSAGDDMNLFMKKAELQFGYWFNTEFLDYTDVEVFTKYGLKNGVDLYVRKNGEKDLTFVFNKNLKPNLNRYLFLKAWSYDLFDNLKSQEELRLSLNSNGKEEDILAERLAIELVMTRWQYKMYLEHPTAGQEKHCARFYEPELLKIRAKFYEDEAVIRNWRLTDLLE